VTHAGNRVHRRRREPVTGSPTGSPGTSGRRTTRRSQLWLRLVLVLLFAGGVAALTPGLASAEGETVSGTLRTRGGGPIPGVDVTVKTADGADVDTATTDDNGRWSVEVPGAGQYTVTLDTGGLPEGITLRGEDTRTVTVDTNRNQGVIFALDNASSSSSGGPVRAVQLLVDGIRFGLLIAMAAIGLSLIFGTTGLTNFAHGELVTAGALVAYFVNVDGGVPLIVAAIIAMIAGAAIGAANELGLWRPLRRRGTGLIAALVVSIGLSLLLRYLFQVIYGGFSNAYSDYRGQRATDYGLFRMTPINVATIFICAVVLVLVALMLQRTRIGKAMRAVADNRDLAASSGINVNRVILVVWMMGGALAALGGVLLGVSDEVQWDMGFRLLLLMFAGVTLGGLGTAYGALVGSLVVGIFVQMSTLIIPNDVKYVGGLLLLIVILIIRPQGILGARVRVG
jgi:branched-subunit amino acid ABC-type transport system permease component